MNPARQLRGKGGHSSGRDRLARVVVAGQTRQCLRGRRIGDLATLQEEIAAWSGTVNDRQRSVNWQMTVADAHCKLKSIYPEIVL